MEIQSRSNGYVGVDELRAAVKTGRIHDVFAETGMRLVAGFPGDHTVYGVKGCLISRCGEGLRLPDDLRLALEGMLNSKIQYKGRPTQYSITISRWRVLVGGAGLGNWVHVRNHSVDAARAVHLGIQLGRVTNVEWRAPALELLGIDLDRAVGVYEYRGEAKHG